MTTRPYDTHPRHSYLTAFFCAALLILTARAAGSQPEAPALMWAIGRLPAVAQLEEFTDQRPVWDNLAASDSPRGALCRLFGAYAHGWSREYRTLLTADFRFEFGESDLRVQWPDGFTAEDERLSLVHLSRGFVNSEGVRLPPASSIVLTAREISICGDPEHPDDPRHYQQVRVGHASLQVMIGEGPLYPLFGGVQLLSLVRGDAAFLDLGQPVDADHWYVRRWVENPLEGAQMAATAGVVRR
jgi:hypothetical protein